MSYYHATFNTNFGWVAIVGSEQGLLCIILPQPDRHKALADLEKELVDLEKALPDIAGLLSQPENASFFGDLIPRLQRYFKGESVDFPDALDLRGSTTFQGDVWALTRTIPYGQTRAYGWIAREIGLPRAGRAVGRALSKNRVSFVVPCHRVIRSDDSLGGYSDIDMKRRLLALEVDRLKTEGS